MKGATPSFVIRTTILVLLALGFAGAHGEADRQVLKRDKFTIKVPSGWSPIPQKDIDELYDNQKAVAKAANKEVPRLDCGFRLALNKDYPRILVSKSDTERITEDVLRQIGSEQWNAGLKNGTRTAEEHANVISKVKPGSSTYDSKNQIIWVRTDAQAEGVGLLKSLAALKLTQTGYIVMAYAAQDADFEKYLTTFTRLAEEMQLDPSIRYSADKKGDSR